MRASRLAGEISLCTRSTAPTLARTQLARLGASEPALDAPRRAHLSAVPAPRIPLLFLQNSIVIPLLFHCYSIVPKNDDSSASH
jgi:hypothetical protein